MKPMLIPFYGSSVMINRIHDPLRFDLGQVTVRQFPDQESYIKFDSDLSNKDLIFITSLENPNPKFLPLVFALKTARELGARRIGLIAPYLPYMRQDKRFSPGEAVTSSYFAKILSDAIDWLITVDPHLHRYHSLNEIYTIPTYVLHANELIADYVKLHFPSPLIIGPDSESEQWVAAIAKRLGVPYVVLEKIRMGDDSVRIKFPNLDDYKKLTPVLVDDIISTGTTMLETLKHLKQIGMNNPVCICVHAIFAKHVDQEILAAGAKSVITCNTIEHVSNDIDVSALINNCLLNINN